MIIYDPKIAILLIAFNRSNIKQVFDRIKVVKPRRLYIAVDESTNDKYVRKQRPLFPTLIGNAKYLNYIRKKIKDTTNTVFIRFLGSSSKSPKESY